MDQIQTHRHRKPRNQKEAGLSLTASQMDDSATDADNSAGNRRRADSKSQLFIDGEKVLAYHGPRIYEAKVQKSEVRQKEWKYFVHYLGWSKTWDEWVSADRLMKYSEENMGKQRALDKKWGVKNNSKSNQTKPKISNVSKGKKRKNDHITEKEIVPIENPVTIQIPTTLKQQLVDDWEFISEKNKYVKLPRSPNVDEILKDYLEYASKKDGMITDSISEILKGLRCYFDRALPVILLYNKEREQYSNAVKNDVSPSTIYGAEHLLRLFVKLPELLPYVNIEDDLLTCLQQKILDFLKFLEKNQTDFFLSSYEDDSNVSEA